MYPPGFETHVEPGALADVMEGAARPGHFRGVTTVVTKLFGAVRPDVAVFGEKDFQQLAIIRRMTRDLDLGIEIVGAPIVREPDGVAMSSRNLRLAPADRAAAACIPRALDAAVAAAGAGGVDAARSSAAAGPSSPTSRGPGSSTSRCSIRRRSARCDDLDARRRRGWRSPCGSATSA